MQQTKNPRNVAQGARNRAAGRLFEEIIEEACLSYSVYGQAEIEKTPEPMQPTKDLGGGKFIAHYAKKAQPDFKGTLAGGRAVAFEAKHTETGKMQQSVVNEEQTKALNKHMSMGAECFVLVSFDFRLFYKIPWEVWRTMKGRYGRKYITPEDVHPYRIVYKNGLLDFLRGGLPHGKNNTSRHPNQSPYTR